MKPFIIESVNGRLNAEETRIRPSRVSSRFRLRNIRKIGITTTTGGMKRVERMKNSWSFLAGIWKREEAQAAGTPSSVGVIVDQPATQTEFLKPESTGESALKTCLTCSSVGENRNSLAGTA